MNAMRIHRWRKSITALLAGLATLAGLAGTPLSLSAAPSQGFGIKVRIKNPPNAVNDLTASGIGVGSIQLAWTAPGNGNGAQPSQYQIRLATYAASSPAQANVWWNGIIASQRLVAATVNSGVIEFTTINSLTPGVTYYFGIKTIDTDGSLSPIDADVGTVTQAQAVAPGAGTSPPSPPANFAGTALSTTSIQWTWDTEATATYYKLDVYPGNTQVAITTSTSYTETGLSPNVAYSRVVMSGNGVGLSSSSAVITLYTHASIPINPSFTNVGFTDISLAWDTSGNPAGTLYRVERSLDGLSYVPLPSVSASTYDDSGLTELTSYYYRIRAFNGDGFITSPSVVISTYTPLKQDFVPPDHPLGLRGTVDPSGNAFTLTWETVLQNADGTAIDDLVGYNIYKRNTLAGTGTKVNAVPLTVNAYADSINGQTFYYTVRAIDLSGNESTDSLVADSSTDANIIYISTDSVTSVIMPKSVNNLLRSGYNPYGVPLDVSLTEQPVPANTNVLRTVTLNIVRGDTREVVNDLAFQLPDTIVGVGYNTINGQPAPGAPNAAQSKSVSAQAVNPEALSFYWNNGVTWVKIGGTVDTVNQMIRTRTSYLGGYQIRLSAAATSLTLEDGNVYPRVFTPNNDGLNDNVYFVLENPNAANISAEILDVKGRLVRTLDPPSSGFGEDTVLTWDGTDLNGATVPGGVYIYRIKGEGKTFTGTIAVAR